MFSPVKSVKSQGGQALIQVVIASAIMGIMMMGMVSMQTMQNKEIKAMAEKMASLDLARVVSLSLTKSCNELIDNSNLVGPPETLTFDATTVSPDNPYVINLKKIPAADLSLGEKASPLSPSLIVQQTNGIQISVTGPNTANLLVNFDKSLLVRGIRDLIFPLYLGSAGPPNSTTITGCQAEGSGTIGNQIDGGCFCYSVSTQSCGPSPGANSWQCWGNAFKDAQGVPHCAPGTTTRNTGSNDGGSTGYLCLK